MLAEVVGGLVTHSLALLADAGHMLSDVAALGLSLFALWIAKRPPTARRTFGYHRMEILAALANGATLIAISLFVFVEAVGRFGGPPEVRGPLMMAIAAGGLCVNLSSLGVLGGGRAEGLNIRGAWLHVLTDALGSVAVLAAGTLIWIFGWNLADPIASMLISLLVTYSAWDLMKEAVGVLLEGTPGSIDLDQVREVMLGVEGVQGVHDLHIWTISSGRIVLSGHAVIANERDHQRLLAELRHLLHERFEIGHATIQIELGDFVEIEHSCRLPTIRPPQDRDG